MTMRENGSVRFEIHVRAGASSTHVGGTHAGMLVVRVVEPPSQGRATAAALSAIADALSVSRRDVALVRGASTRRKLIDIDVDDVQTVLLDAVLEELRKNG
jgi:uncharacterized protein YggU (UPF0235/DUF167 family)